MSYLFVLVPVFDMFAGMWNWNTWHSDLVFSEWKWTAISELLMANVSLFCYGMAIFIVGFHGTRFLILSQRYTSLWKYLIFIWSMPQKKMLQMSRTKQLILRNFAISLALFCREEQH